MIPPALAVPASFRRGGSGFVACRAGIAPVGPDALAQWPCHLIYHLYPLKDSVWRRNIDELKRRSSLFTGRRLITVALDERSAPREEVLAELQPVNADVRFVENQQLFGEALTLLNSLNEVVTLPGITFYAHGKGVSHSDPTVVFDHWARLMYTLLDRVDEVRDLLSRHGFCGLVRSCGQPIAEGEYQWHYPGSFYWFRNDVVTQRGWNLNHMTRFFSEQFPSRTIRFTESAALFPDLLAGSPYNKLTWLPYMHTLSATQAAVAAAPVSQSLLRRQELPHFTAGKTRPADVPAATSRSGTIIPASHEPLAFQTLKGDVTVCVIITCHNYGKYLREAIQSVLDQSRPVQEILVVDDSSTDNTQEVARSFQSQGVRYLKVEVRNSFRARHAGLAETTGQIVLFLDADNYLTTRYIETGLQEFTDQNVGVVYADLRKFGRENHLTNFPEYSRAKLMQANFVDTCALIRRAALEVSDAFQRDVDAMKSPDDYVMFQRLAMEGWHFKKQTSYLMYRTHRDQQSRRALRENNGHRHPDEYCISHHEVTLFIPLSGRDFAWKAQSQFLEEQTWPHQRIRLILCDTSQRAEFSQSVRQWIAQSDYPDVRHQLFAPAPAGLADQNRRQRQVERDVQLAMCRIYNRLRAGLETDYCWILEDDVIPPKDALGRLMARFEPNVGCVCAPYPSRWDPDYVVWSADVSGRPGHVQRMKKPLPPEPQVREVRGSGFGCVVLRSELIQKHIFQLPPGEIYYDQYFFRVMGDEWKRLCDWTAECEHLGASR